MSYDDVPNAPENPYPGKLYNHPGNFSIDVNEGCVKDYTGAQVTVTHFLNVIEGNALSMIGIGSGRVLKSGPNDHVFIYFVDHGGPGVLSFPTTYLYSHQLVEAFSKMKSKGMYNKLVFYLEACYSGSMFEDILEPSLNVYAVTAANATESSWGAYCPPNDYVDGIELDVCLGDLFSINWLQNTDNSDLSMVTLEQQYETVEVLTNLSHVEKFGNLTIDNESLSEFLGNWTSASIIYDPDMSGNWANKDMKIEYLTHLFSKYPTPENLSALEAELEFREKISHVFTSLIMNLEEKYSENVMESALTPVDTRCLEKNVLIFEGLCGKLDEFGLQYVQILVNACEIGISNEEIESSLSIICTA